MICQPVLGLVKPRLSVYGEFRFSETCLLSRHMGVRSSRLAISVFEYWKQNTGKAKSEADLDFTFMVWLVSTKIIKNDLYLIFVYSGSGCFRI